MKLREYSQSSQRTQHSNCPDNRETGVLHEHSNPREHDDTEIDHVPAIPQVRVPFHEEPLSTDLEDALDRVDYLERVLKDVVDWVFVVGIIFRWFDGHDHAVSQDGGHDKSFEVFIINEV